MSMDPTVSNLDQRTRMLLSGDLAHVFLAQSVGLTVFGLINAAAVARGAWRSAGQAVSSSGGRTLANIAGHSTS